MSASFSSSKRLASTSSPIDINQKELLVSQLKAEILELKQNEREYLELATQVRKFEQRYQLLQEETAKGESDFKIRNKQNFETIVNLRTDIDTMKGNIADTKVEIQELRTENAAVKDLAEQKGKELERYKSDVAEASEENNMLSSTRRRLESELDVAREEKRKTQTQVKDAGDSLSRLNYKVNELEKVMKEMEYSNTKTERQNAQLQQSIDSMTSELKTRNENLETVEQQVADSQKAILNLERDIQDAERDNDRSRSEALEKQKIYQQEVAKGLDLDARLTVTENTLKAREIELEELRREYESLKVAHSNMLDTNFQLKQELDTVQSDISGLSTQNSEIVVELDRLAQEDEQVRVLLNRQNRVEALKFKSESQIRKSGYKTRGSPSPGRKSPLKSGSSLRKSPYKY